MFFYAFLYHNRFDRNSSKILMERTGASERPPIFWLFRHCRMWGRRSKKLEKKTRRPTGKAFRERESFGFGHRPAHFLNENARIGDCDSLFRFKLRQRRRLPVGTSAWLWHPYFCSCFQWSGWPSGPRRCVQFAVWFSRRGFESHFWQFFFPSSLFYVTQLRTGKPRRDLK